jgi:hypothetical protein
MEVSTITNPRCILKCIYKATSQMVLCVTVKAYDCLQDYYTMGCVQKFYRNIRMYDVFISSVM